MKYESDSDFYHMVKLPCIRENMDLLLKRPGIKDDSLLLGAFLLFAISSLLGTMFTMMIVIISNREDALFFIFLSLSGAIISAFFLMESSSLRVSVIKALESLKEQESFPSVNEKLRVGRETAIRIIKRYISLFCAGYLFFMIGLFSFLTGILVAFHHNSRIFLVIFLLFIVILGLVVRAIDECSGMLRIKYKTYLKTPWKYCLNTLLLSFFISIIIFSYGIFLIIYY